MKVRFALGRCLFRHPSVIITTAFVSLVLLISSCHKDSARSATSVPSGLQMVSSGYAPGAATRVDIYTADQPYVGYNKLYIYLYDSVSHSPISQAQVSLSATMMMSGHSQSAPIEDPAYTTATDYLFGAAAVFTAAGDWVLTVHVHSTTGRGTGDFSAPLTVVLPSPARAYSISAPDSSTLFVSIVQPLQPRIGINTFELAIYRQVAMDFTADSTYSVAINPTMPFMTGMSSPNNVNPVYIGNGHYTGKVDFIMSGGWRIYVDIMHYGAVADTLHYYDINL